MSATERARKKERIKFFSWSPSLLEKPSTRIRRPLFWSCRSCWAVEGKTWFTSRHHRETPDRIEKGEADVGIVWTTEVVHAKAEGRPIDGVAIPAPLNKQDKVNYAIGIMKNGRNQDNASKYLAYLATDAAQAIYEEYGFLRASADELSLKAL